MITKLLYLYSKLSQKDNFLYSICRKLTKAASNILVYSWLFYFIWKPKKVKNDNELKVVVSLTSFKPRLPFLWITIFSILHQNYKPYKILLWLSEEDVKSFDKLPKTLQRLSKNESLEIIFVKDNLKSHKKYLYAFHKYKDKVIVTLDDDIIYPPNIVENLVHSHLKNRKSVICNFGNEIPLFQHDIPPYICWKTVTHQFDDAKSNIIPIGAGGVLYPPESLHPNVFNSKKIKKYCPSADDLWLWIHFRLNGYKLIVPKSIYGLISIINPNNVNLYKVNVLNYQNDIQLAKLNEYLLKEFHISIKDLCQE